MNVWKWVGLSGLLFISLISPASVDLHQYVKIGGIDQHIWIKGEKAGNPILLFLHGGPGRSVEPYAPDFNDSLYHHFLVVHWDQRMTGKTLQKNHSEVTLALLQSDTRELTEYLLQRFNQKKLLLVSHSWSSYLGLEMAKKYPSMLLGYVAISPVIDQEKSSAMTIDQLKKWAIKTKNDQALKDLESIHVPLEMKEDLFLQQKWLFTHNGETFALDSSFRLVYFEWMDVWFPVLLESWSTSVWKNYTSLSAPIYIFEGNADGLDAHDLVTDFFNQLKADRKELIWFENSGHTIFNTEPKRLQVEMIRVLSTLNVSSN